MRCESLSQHCKGEYPGPFTSGEQTTFCFSGAICPSDAQCQGRHWGASPRQMGGSFIFVHAGWALLVLAAGPGAGLGGE